MSDSGKIIALARAAVGDLKNEISEKISEPESEGTSGQILTTDGNGGRVWTTPSGSGVVIDDTLSVSGAAADAEKTGKIKSTANLISEVLVCNYKEIPGKSINASGQMKTSTSKKLCCYRVKEGTKFSSSATNTVLAFYTSEPTTSSVSYNNSRSTYTSIEDVTVPAGCTWVAIRANTADTVTITPSSYVIDKIQTDLSISLKNFGMLKNSDNLNNFKDDGVYSFASGNTVSNCPMSGKPGLLIVTKAFNSDKYAEQICLPYYPGSYSLEYRYASGMYIRRLTNNSWSPWTFIKLTPRNHTGKYYAFGDSIVWGYSSDHDHDQSPWNYPAIVGDLIGVDVHNEADPAQGLIKDWTSPATTGNFPIVDTIASMVSNGDFENTVLITVGWAYNDASLYSGLNFGNTTDPIPENTTGITTFLGYYAKILQILQDAAPTAVVMLVTGYGSPCAENSRATCKRQFDTTYTFADGGKTTKQIYDSLEEMANYHGFPCVNQAKGTCINKVNCQTIIEDNIHPTYDNYRIYGNFVASRIVSMFQNI